MEAGVDFSFQTGFREVSSLLSLLQAAGRVNRNGEMDNAVMWSFQMQEDPKKLTKNPHLGISISVLNDFFGKRQRIVPELSTEAIKQELDRGRRMSDETLLEHEETCRFPKVAEKFRIIDTDTVLVAVDDKLKDRIKNHTADWREIQRKCVSIWRKKGSKYHLRELCEGVYDWELGYDSFLGVMAGGLEYIETENGVLMI